MITRILCSSPSKIIFFGEHAVVYGYPAIVSAISKRSYCEISQRTDKQFKIKLIDFKSSRNYNLNNLNLNFEENDKRFAPFYSIIKDLHKEYNFKVGINIKIYSDIPVGAGLGSSASINVSLTNALNHFFGLNLSKKQVSEKALIGERVIHGNPSGIDNTIASFGGILWYQKGEFEPFEIKEHLSLIVSNTKIHRNTSELIKNVRTLYEKQENKVTEMFESIKEIVSKAKTYFQNNNLPELGNLMSQNQKLLEKIGVSNSEIENLINIANKNGAYGSKLTGAGGGGCIISLTDQNNEQKLLKALRKKSDSFKVILDTQGTILEN